MNKLGQILIVFVFVTVAYIMLMLLQPFTNSVVATANVSTANWTNFPGGQEAVVGWPLWSYFVPISIGLVAVVSILRS